MQSAKIYEARLGALHAKTANALNSVGTIHHLMGRLPEAKAHYERARQGLEAALGPGHARVAFVLFNLALIEREAKEILESRGLFQRALNIRETVYGRSHVLVADTLEELAILEVTNGRGDEARPLFERTLAIRQELHRAGHPLIWNATKNLALLYAQSDEPERGRTLLSKLVEDWTGALGDDDPALAQPLVGLAEFELGQGQPAAAIAPARRAVALPGTDAASLAHAQFTLARALSPEPRRAVNTESLELARAALAGYGDSKAHAGSKAEVQAWLSKRGE